MLGEFLGSPTRALAGQPLHRHRGALRRCGRRAGTPGFCHDPTRAERVGSLGVPLDHERAEEPSFRREVALANGAFECSDFRVAQTHYARAARSATSVASRAWALKNAGIAARRTGDLDAALRLARRARLILEEDPQLDVGAEIDLLLGNCLADRSEWTAAEGMLVAAAAAFERAGRQTEYVQTMISRGRIAVERAGPSAALEFFEDMAQMDLPATLRSQILNNLGLLYKRLGSHARARAALEEDIELCRGTGDRYGEAVSAFNLATLLLELGQGTEGHLLAERSAKLFSAVGAVEQSERARRLEADPDS
jgi:tetratricopeptide (TPR) repeat protein